MFQNSTQGDNITVCSLNVRGLSNNQKRRETFLWLKKGNLYFLQEVHSTREPEICWQSVWGYSTTFTNFASSRAGVGILFNNNLHFQLFKYFVDPEGRFIIADTEIQDKTLTLVNIYAPNKDEPTFFQNVCENLSSFDCDFIIFGGDFNLVCNIHKDKKGGIPTTHSKSRDKVEILRKILDQRTFGVSSNQMPHVSRGEGKIQKFNVVKIFSLLATPSVQLLAMLRFFLVTELTIQ